MRLPYAERAQVDPRKLRDYCLNPAHPEGKHKARKFHATLGMTSADADALRDILLQVILTHDVQVGWQDQFGQRYTLDFWLDWQGHRVLIRSGWILEPESDSPRLTSCYPL